jgi:hypothetical protein
MKQDRINTRPLINISKLATQLTFKGTVLGIILFLEGHTLKVLGTLLSTFMKGWAGASVVGGRSYFSFYTK